MAQLALGIAGAAIGSAFGGIGASIGWSIGAALGGALFPQKVEGPRLADLRLQKSSYGGMIPIVYGTIRTPGNVIWQTDLTEHKHSSSGKGGPEQTNFTYSASFAIGLCEGPIVDVFRVWANGRLVFDKTQGSDFDSGEFTFKLYLGDEEQLADPTMQASIGADLVPAYRGLAYVVFTDFTLTDFGNTIPNLEFEVVTKGITGCSMHEKTIVTNATPGYDTTTIVPAITGLRDGQFRVTAIRFGGGALDAGTGSPQIDADATYLYDATTLESLGADTSGGPIANSADSFPRNVDLIGSDLPSNPGLGADNRYFGVGIYVTSDDTRRPLYLSDKFHQIGVATGILLDELANNPSLVATLYPPIAINLTAGQMPDGTLNGNHSYAPSGDFAYLAGVPAGLYLQALSLSGNGRALYVFTDTVQTHDQDEPILDFNGDPTGHTYASSGQYCRHWYKIVDGVVVADGGVGPYPPVLADAIGFSVGNPGPGGPRNSFDNGGKYLWTFDSVGDTVRLFVMGDDGVITRDDACGAYSPSRSGGNSGSIYAFRTGYALVVTDSTVAIVTRFPAGASSAVTLAEIVSNVSARCAYDVETDIDVSDIPDPVDGAIVTQQGTGRAILEQFMSAYSVDAAEIDDVIVWKHRGKASIATIADGDLAAHDEGSDLPAPLNVVRADELQLPARLNVDYMNNGADYQTGTQAAERQITESVIKTTVTFPIAMSDAKAKAIAQTLLFEPWYQRDKGTIYVPRKWAKLTPTDVITVKGRDWKIKNVGETPKGVFKLDIVPSSPAIYAQPAKSAPSSGISSGGALSTKAASDLLLLDIPLILDGDSQNGFTAIMAPHGSGPWSGASLQKSSDGGTTYAELTNSSVRGTIGAATAALGNFYGGNVFDEMNVVSVVLSAGTLSGIAAAAVLNGGNEALLGDEIIQYKNAELTDANTYALSGLLRGRRGTEWAMGSHQAGDRFAVLPGIDVNAPLADLGRERNYKAVTFGKTLASATAQAFTNRGQRLKPYSPVHLGGGSDASGNATINWTRRTRVGGNWVDFVDVPLSETTEAYVVQIWDSTYSQCARIIPASVQTASYSAADQVTDFGVEQQTIYFTVGQIGAYGIGRQAQGSVPGIGGSNNAPLAPVTPYNNPVVPPPTSGTCTPIGSVINSTVSWTTPVRVFSGPFGTDDVWVVQFTTGASVAGVGLIQFGYVTGFESIAVDASIALSPCGAALIADETGVFTPSFGFQTPTSDPSSYISLTPNTTYYVSIVPSAPHSMYCEILPSR